MFDFFFKNQRIIENGKNTKKIQLEAQRVQILKKKIIKKGKEKKKKL
jgi:hypothetical protein